MRRAVAQQIALKLKLPPRHAIKDRIRTHQLIRRKRTRIAHRQRQILRRRRKHPPHIVKRETAVGFEFRLIPAQHPQRLRGRILGRDIDMDKARRMRIHRLPRQRRALAVTHDRRRADDQPVGAGDALQQRLDLGRIDRLALRLVAKIRHRASMIDEGKTLARERRRIGRSPRIAQHHRLRIKRNAVLALILGKITRLLAHRGEIIHHPGDKGFGHAGSPPFLSLAGE